MKYLLDVSTLIAFGLRTHQLHGRTATWVQSQSDATLLTCSITELGFVRILAQVPNSGLTVANSMELLLQMKADPVLRLIFVPDGNDISLLPGWVKYPKQTTDGHLVQLANTHGAVLATLDEGISGAYLIP
jgi:predicted nucleic acid-binding protein